MYIPRKKLLIVFTIAFVTSFTLLNSRFLVTTSHYYLKKSDFIRTEPSVKFLPIAEAVERRPLPNSATLVIDGIGVTAPIVFDSLQDEKTIYKNLEKGTVLYPGTPKPGQDGVAIVLGHSSAYPWYRGGYGSVFALLNKLNPGDKIYVQYSDNRVFTFEVKQSLIFNPFSDDERLRAIEDSDGKKLVLVSCWPVGTAYKRIAIEAQLVEN